MDGFRVPVMRDRQVVRGLPEPAGLLRHLPEDGAAVADQVGRQAGGRADPLGLLGCERGQPVGEQRMVLGRRDAQPADRAGYLGRRPAARPRSPGRSPGRHALPRGCPGRRSLRGAREPVDAAVPVHPDRGACPLAPRGGERVRRLGRRVDARHLPAQLREGGGERGGHLRCPAGDQQRHRRIVHERTARLTAVRGLPPAEQQSGTCRCAGLPAGHLRAPSGLRGLHGGQQQGVLGRPRPQVAARRRGEPVQVGGGTPAHEVMLPVVRSCRDLSFLWCSTATGRHDRARWPV